MNARPTDDGKSQWLATFSLLQTFEGNMRYHLPILVFLLSISAAAHAENAAPGVTVEADQTKSVTADTVQAVGHVVIKSGATEIRTDRAKIVTGEHDVKVYTDTFTASVKK